MEANVKAPEDIFGRLAELARAKTPFLADIWQRSRQEFGAAWVEELAENVVRLFGAEDDGNWEAAIRGYAEFALDAMRSQQFFEAHGRYQWSTSKEIQRHYYDSEAYMMTKYLPGLYLSHYLWPHHFKLLRFFRTEVLPRMTPAPARFYDVGIGTGIYSREVLCAFPAVRGTGVDLSSHSVAFTRKLLHAYGVLDRYTLVLGDILTSTLPRETADFVVSQEVLEHVEDPQRLLGMLHDLTKPGAKAYITAAINAGHSDHIYLFRSPTEVQTMLTKAGWRVLIWRAEFAYTGTPIELTPCVAGFLCER